MKKSLLALAVLGAFASVASAQSSVTLYGTLDVNLTYLSNGMPQSDYLSGGTYSLIQKNSNRTIFGAGEFSPKGAQEAPLSVDL